MKLRKYLGIMLASSLLLTACGSKTPGTQGTTSSSPSPAPTAQVSETTKELNIWTYFSGNEQKMFGELSDKFAQENNVKVNVEYIPFGDYKKQVSVAIASDSLPDIIMIDNPDHAAFASMGVFEDITDKINAWEAKDKYFEGPLASTMLDGKYYGIPVTSNCLALFYNEQMLADAGVQPPTNWTELQEVAKKLTNAEVFGLGVGSPKMKKQLSNSYLG